MAADSARQPPGTRDVMVVSNNWAGTATIVDARSYEVLTTINVVPDLDEELQHVKTPSESHPAGAAFYYAIQQGVGEGHDQYVDDSFTTLDGRHLAVSRPSLRDVVWLDVAKAAAAGEAGDPDSIVAEVEMDGYRTDHMGLSPDGRRLVVSDSTARQVVEFSMVDETLPDGSRVTMGQRLRASSPATPRTRTTTRPMGSASSTPRSDGCTRPATRRTPTTVAATPAKATAGFRS